MSNFIKSVIALCLFQAKPQDLPGTPNLPWITAAFAVIVNALTSWPAHHFLTVLQLSIVQAAAMGLTVWVILHWSHHPERWSQTATALFAAGGAIQLAGSPAYIWFERIKDASDATVVPVVLVGLLGLWYFAVMVNVLRHALEISVLLGVLTSFTVQLVVGAIVLGLFPHALPT